MRHAFDLSTHELEIGAGSHYHSGLVEGLASCRNPETIEYIRDY